MINYKLILLVLLLCAPFTNLIAQENLKKWFDDCEKTPAVNMMVINSKDPETKKASSKVIKVTLKESDKELEKSLLAAFEKDKDNAYTVSEKRVNGVNMMEYCRFYKDKTELRFLFDFSKNKRVVTMQIFYNFEQSGG